QINRIIGRIRRRHVATGHAPVLAIKDGHGLTKHLKRAQSRLLDGLRETPEELEVHFLPIHSLGTIQGMDRIMPPQPMGEHERAMTAAADQHGQGTAAASRGHYHSSASSRSSGFCTSSSAR